MAGRSTVGLDVGTSAVRAAEMSFGRSGATLQRFGQVALPPGAVRDGEVADPQLVADALRRLWSGTGFGTKRVVLGVANQRVIVRQVDLPWLPANELRGSLAMQVQDYLPIPVDQAILDYHPIAEVSEPDGARTIRILIVAASREMVANLLDAVKRAGLRTSRIDLTAFAVLRALGEVDALGVNPELHGNAEALVNVGAKVTNIVVHQNGVPRFVRILPMGGDHVTDAVSERMGVPFEQAESVKQELGLSVASAPMPVRHPAATVIDSTAGAFLDEVRGSLAYYATQPGALQVRRVVLSGGGGLLPGLGQRLATTVQLPVQRGSALAAIRVGKTGLGPEQLEAVDSQLAVSVGLAMADAS